MDGEDAESSLKVYKTDSRDIRIHSSLVNPDRVEELLESSIQLNKQTKSQLERSASSTRRQRRAMRELLVYEVGKQAIGEGKIVV